MKRPVVNRPHREPVEAAFSPPEMPAEGQVRVVRFTEEQWADIQASLAADASVGRRLRAFARDLRDDAFEGARDLRKGLLEALKTGAADRAAGLAFLIGCASVSEHEKRIAVPESFQLGKLVESWRRRKAASNYGKKSAGTGGRPKKRPRDDDATRREVEALTVSRRISRTEAARRVASKYGVSLATIQRLFRA